MVTKNWSSHMCVVGPHLSGVQGHPVTSLDEHWRLEDADKQEKDKSQNDDAYED
jgi:hypothetical protein